jgi:uncharacterized protein
MGGMSRSDDRAMDALTADDVAAFLRDHPDFLRRRPDVIPFLLAEEDDGAGDVVDMQRFLLNRLRDQLGEIGATQRHLLDVTRANLLSQRRVHEATLHLLARRDLEGLAQFVTGGDFAALLDVDITALVMEQPPGPVQMLFPHGGPAGLILTARGAVGRIMGNADILLHADILGSPEIWGDAVGMVRSQALARLVIGDGEREGPTGLLAFGSSDRHGFHEGQATDLLNFIARVLERVIGLHLD